VRLAGLEFASTLLRQPLRSYLKPTFFYYIELYLFLEQSVGSGMDPDPEKKLTKKDKEMKKKANMF
jgi:hypothetical protein